MDSFLPVFYALLKVFGVKNPSEGMIYFFIIDMLFPFVMAIAFGFLMGAITVFCIMKIAQLEKTNKELLEKIEKKKESEGNSKEEEQKVKEENEEEKVVEEEKKEEEPKKEAKTLKEIIKPDPEFKRPEITTPKHNEEEEWAVVTKKGKVKKIKSE